MSRLAYFKHRVAAGISDEGGLIPAAKKALLLLRKGGIGHMITGGYQAEGQVSYADWVNHYDRLTHSMVEQFKSDIATADHLPTFSIIVPTYKTPLSLLQAMVSSVRHQIYPHWELCIADDASEDPELHRYLEELSADERIKVMIREQNGHISACSNSALALADGEWTVLLDHDDELTADALYQLARVIWEHPSVRMIYSDEDKLDAKGGRARAYFKPAFNREMLRSNNYITHLACYRTDELKALGGFREGFEGAQDHDLVLRYTERLRPSEIVHIPIVLYHWREHEGSTSTGIGVKNYALDAGQKAVAEHLARTGLQGSVEANSRGYYTVAYDVPNPPPSVAIVIPTRNQVALLKACIRSIRDKTAYKNYRVVVINNGSDCQKTLQFLDQLDGESWATVLHDERPFNYSQLNNHAVDQVDADFVLLMNNDIEVISPNWLCEMMSTAVQPDVGAVGAKLLYPDGTIQHSGLVLGIGGSAGHAFKHHSGDDLGYWFRGAVRSEFSAVTGACLLVRRKIFLEVGGLDEEAFKVAFNDVDFCLKVKALGLRNVFCPAAVLYHHESKSRGFEDNPYKRARFARERSILRQRWLSWIENDPGYNVNLTRDAENFCEARNYSARSYQRRVTPLLPDDFDALPSVSEAITPGVVTALKGVFNPHDPMFGWILLVGSEFYEAAVVLKRLRPQSEITLLVSEDDALINQESALDDISVSLGDDDWLDSEPYDLIIARESGLGRLSGCAKSTLERLVAGGSILIVT